MLSLLASSTVYFGLMQVVGFTIENAFRTKRNVWYNWLLVFWLYSTFLKTKKAHNNLTSKTKIVLPKLVA